MNFDYLIKPSSLLTLRPFVEIFVDMDKEKILTPHQD